MIALDRIRAELHHTRRVYHGHDHLAELVDRFDHAADTPSAVEYAEQIADLLRSQAAHLDASRLARATTALPSPVGLRADAGEWDSRARALRAPTSWRAAQ